MSDKPVLHSENFANTEYDGNRRARAEKAAEAEPAREKPTLEPVTGINEAPEVDLVPKGTGEVLELRTTEIMLPSAGTI